MISLNLSLPEEWIRKVEMFVLVEGGKPPTLPRILRLTLSIA
jgi:hypothetical protein